MDKTPENGQRLLFSATLDNGVDKLVRRYLHNEVLHSVDEANSPVAAMTHHVFEVESVEAKRLLVERLASGQGRRLLFMRTKHHAKKLARQLTDAGIPAVDLHGNLSQVARDRNLAEFAAGTSRVLVATDVAARGVHVDDIELVIHVDPPAEHKAYLHRSGRTARAGAEGDVVTIVLPTQRKDTADLLRKAQITVTPERVTASSDAVTALVGDVAAYVKPRPRAAEPERGARGSGSRSAGSRSAGSRQSQGGRSQGANAQRKRALREGGQSGQSSQPRRARSAEQSIQGPSQPQRSTQQPARSAEAPSRPRGGNGRAQSSGGIKVGQVVRPNRRGSR
jgi:superfamily II DNA/RNA helicase